MQEYLGYILAGLVFIMAVVLIIAITKIVGMEREIRESRRETAPRGRRPGEGLGGVLALEDRPFGREAGKREDHRATPSPPLRPARTIRRSRCRCTAGGTKRETSPA